MSIIDLIRQHAGQMFGRWLQRPEPKTGMPEEISEQLAKIDPAKWVEVDGKDKLWADPYLGSAFRLAYANDANRSDEIKTAFALVALALVQELSDPRVKYYSTSEASDRTDMMVGNAFRIVYVNKAEKISSLKKAFVTVSALMAKRLTDDQLVFVDSMCGIDLKKPFVPPPWAVGL